METDTSYLPARGVDMRLTFTSTTLTNTEISAQTQRHGIGPTYLFEVTGNWSKLHVATQNRSVNTR